VIDRGSILPDTAGHDDGWMVLSVRASEVVVVDLVFLSVWRWSRHSDGIRVAQALSRGGDMPQETDWVARAITQDPPPADVEQHLRHR